MKKNKLDTIISLAPLALAVLVPVGRYIFGKVIDKQKEKNELDKQKEKKE